MKSNDILFQKKDTLREAMQSALKENDTEGFYNALDQMMELIADGVRQDYESQISQMKNETDSSVLSARGVRQLTTKEREYYQKLAEAMKSREPKQALANLDVVMPETVIDAVFDELQSQHPLLSRIQFTPVCYP